jgi:hypothetical protein
MRVRQSRVPASYAMILSSLTLSKTHLYYGRRVDLALFKVTVVDLTLVLCLCSFRVVLGSFQFVSRTRTKSDDFLYLLPVSVTV